MNAYRRYFDGTKYVFFFIKDDELVDKCNEICKKVSNTTKNGFDSELLYNEKYLKTKLKFHKGKISTNFHNGKIPDKGSQCICLSYQ